MIGINIRNLRKKKSLTQNELAKKLGVSRQAICMWEADKREPDVVTFNKLARFFDVTLDEIARHTITVTEKEGNMALGNRFKKAIEKGGECMVKKTKQKSIDFQLKAPNAKTVALTGSFNSWNNSGISMKKDKTGTWRISLDLEPGKYEYKFIVDGQWWTDPNNKNVTFNSFGSQNSVTEVAS